MANVPMSPANVGTFQMNVAGMTYYKSPIINSLAGTPIDFSTWDSLETQLQIDPGVILGGPGANGINIVGNADGTLTFELDGSLLTAYRSGNFPLVAFGRPAPGDTYQTVGTGSVSFTNLTK
jgi:hypothetical protein